MSGPPRSNTEAEIEAFGSACERLAGFDDALSTYRIDGWLAALACSPARPAQAQWLEWLCGETFERVFADPEDREQALRAFEARLAVLHDELDAQALLDAPDRLRLDPLFDEWTDEDRAAAAEAAAPDSTEPDQSAGLQTGVLWAEGVLDGLDALAEQGLVPQNDETAAEVDELVAQVEALLLVPGSEPWQVFMASFHPDKPSPDQAPTRDELLAEACFALQELRVFLLDHAPRPPPRQVQPAPGRNDPCPCGSGKKFKKCHGA